MYDALPSRERSFDADYVGQITGHRYKGTFTVYCVLDISQMHAAELEKSRLTLDIRNPTNGLKGVSNVLGELRTRIIEGPAWWKDSKLGTSILDFDLLSYLLDKCDELEDLWKDEIKKKAGEIASKND